MRVADGEVLVCAGPALALVHHCFSSLGQETAVESEAEVTVSTQPFEGYTALQPISIKLRGAGLSQSPKTTSC